MGKYKVSVIVPVYNVEKYLAKCLDSLVNQTLKDIEIIVVNDGSTDNSEQIIKKYLKKYPDKIIYLKKENGGQGSARNLGIEKSNGEYIGFVDSDDYADIKMFEKLYNIGKINNSDIVITRDSTITENGNIYDNQYFNKFENKKENAFFGNMGVCNKIYRRSLIENIKFKEKVWYEDLAFTIKTLINANKIDYYFDESLYYYLKRNGSTMNNSNVDRNLEILLAFDDALEYINENKYNKYYEVIEFLAIDHIYISTIVRIINADVDKNKKKEVIDKLINYMNNNFPNFEKNKYISSLSRNRKIIYNLIKYKKYKMVKLIFKIKKG